MHRVRVLLVDEHEDHMESLRMLFESRDCVVLDCDDGNTAVSLVAEHAPDVVIVDADLFGACGVVAAAHDANPRGAYVICLSTRWERPQTSATLACDLRLPKPYDFIALFGEVEGFIARRAEEKRASNGRRD
jgi:DNA-binding response OmpR family regulator